MDFSQEVIKKRFSYNPETGEIINNYTKRPVTYKDDDGYICCGCLHNGVHGRMRGARLVWVMHYGDIPEGYIVDHKNRVRDDNRLDNLRLATNRDNSVNVSKKEDVSSIYKGVQLDRWNRWQASIQTDRVTTQLGRYSTEEAAAHAYNVEAYKRHGEFAVLNNVPQVNLEDFISERDRDFLTRERRGLPKNTVRVGKDVTLRINGKTLARFKPENIQDAILCADHYNNTGEVLDLKTNIVVYNKYGLPPNITPCSTGFRASFIVERKRYHVGTFKTLEEAVVALETKQRGVLDGS